MAAGDLSAGTPFVTTRVEVTPVKGRVTKKLDRTKLVQLGVSGAVLDAATAVVQRVRGDYEVWAPDVTEALAAARLTGQQLKLAATEVRRSPWKLLYRPERAEFEHELLYEATRAFAMAASDLKAASASAQRITDTHGAGSPLDETTRQLVNDMLGSALERYATAQENLATVLFAEYGAK